jgi:hypothetical protein
MTLCNELEVSRTTLYRHVTATGEVTAAGKRALGETRKPKKKVHEPEDVREAARKFPI